MITATWASAKQPADEPNLAWIEEATKYMGLTEITSKRRHNKTIINWLKQLGGWWRDDETPWCGTFVAHCLKTAGRSIPQHWYRAKAYLDYGTPVAKPCYGCIAIKSRRGGGHVFFVVGKTHSGYIVGLGGNQGNKVSLAKFKPSDIDGYVWASRGDGSPSMPYPHRFNIPFFNENLQANISEA